MARKRPQLKLVEVIKHLQNIQREVGDIPIFLAPSILNLDEPKETQEFIDSDRKIKCVAIEYCPGQPKFGVTLGWAEK